MTGAGSGGPGSSTPEPEELQGIPQAGEAIAGKFVVEKVLGVGGMGVVVAAKHVHLGQKVAIKFLRKDAAKNREAIDRFLREARSAVGLQSAHVVRVMDVGVLDDGMPYMVMEHLSGTDLNGVLEERKTLPVQEAVDYVLQGMEAIAEAHALGIVHRDLKPANLFLTRSPDGSPLVKVLDFGISKAADTMRRQEQSLTATSAVMGSPLYMSPEQLRSSKNVDVRTDVWALGVILYELLAGQPPFVADTVTGLCAKIAADPATPLRAVDPSISPALEAIVMRCLEKDMARRFATVADLALALHPFASAEGRISAERTARIGKPAASGSHASAGGPSSGAGSSSDAHLSTGYAETQANWQTGAQRAQLRRRNTALAVIGVGALAVGSFVAMAGYKSVHPQALPAAAGASVAPPVAAPPGSIETPVMLAPPPGGDPSAAASDSLPPSAPSSSAPPPSRPHPSPAVAPPRAPQPRATAAAPKPDDLLLDRK